MNIHRRQFLRYCIGSAAALSLPLSVVGRLEQALAAGGATLPKVIWLNAANCTGCTVSLANRFSSESPTDVVDLLLNTIDLTFHPTLMGAAGDLAVQQLKTAAAGNYILAIEGGIPTAFNGHTCLLWTDQGQDVTAMEAVRTLAPKAAAILCIGTCASYGGIAGANPNPTAIVSVGNLTGLATINIPGCPTHPDWIVWTIAHLLAGQTPALDDRSRPVALYGTSVHSVCPRREQDEAKIFGVAGKCLEELGCKGPDTKADCPSRKWNGGSNWCIGAGALCVGCTEPGFPDKFSPFCKLQYTYSQFDQAATQQPQPDTQQPAPEPTPGSLEITKAQWDGEKKELRVEGKGTRGLIVTIFNAGTGTQLGAVSVNDEGVWKFLQRSPSPVPTRIKAVCGSLTAYRDVSR